MLYSAQIHLHNMEESESKPILCWACAKPIPKDMVLLGMEYYHAECVHKERAVKVEKSEKKARVVEVKRKILMGLVPI